MIIVIARAEFDPAQLVELEPALDEMMRATWDESGCLGYSKAIESRNGGVCTIVERWADETALQKHFTTAHKAAFEAAIEDAVHSIDARVYDVSGERSLKSLFA
jgi:quinol monooxygenase YgiN